VNRALKGLCNVTFPERLRSNASRVPSSAVSSLPGLAVVIASLLTEPLVKFGGEVNRAEGKVERVIGAVNATESASDVAVKSDICQPMWTRGGVRQLGAGGPKGCLGVGCWHLALMRAASRLSERRQSETSESGFCDLRYENERMWLCMGGWDSQAAVKSKKKGDNDIQNPDYAATQALQTGIQTEK